MRLYIDLQAPRLIAPGFDRCQQSFDSSILCRLRFRRVPVVCLVAGMLLAGLTGCSGRIVTVASAASPTDPPSTPPTNPPTNPPSNPPTNPPSNPPTNPPSNPPTNPPSNPPTDPPTNPPTDPPTNPPTDPPSNPPSNPPTQPTDPVSSLPTVQASAAASFIDSVGVVTHLSYTDTPYYTDFPQIPHCAPVSRCSSHPRRLLSLACLLAGRPGPSSVGGRRNQVRLRGFLQLCYNCSGD